MSLSADHTDRQSLIDHYSDPAEALEAERMLVERFRDPAVNYHVAWWTTSQSLVAPRSLKRAPDIENAMSLSASSGWPVFFRQTGGDVTPQGAGVLNVAVAFALDPTEQPSITAVYQMFCTPMIGWLNERGCNAQTGFVPGSFCDGEYNIVVNVRKVAGTAQRWTRIRAGEPRQIVFAHALLLLDADIKQGVAAINQLYESCQMERVVQTPVHANLRDLLIKPAPDWQDELVRELSDIYTAELIMLTS